jgi:hypothetical protein
MIHCEHCYGRNPDGLYRYQGCVCTTQSVMVEVIKNRILEFEDEWRKMEDELSRLSDLAFDVSSASNNPIIPTAENVEV